MAVEACDDLGAEERSVRGRSVMTSGKANMLSSWQGLSSSYARREENRGKESLGES